MSLTVTLRRFVELQPPLPLLLLVLVLAAEAAVHQLPLSSVPPGLLPLLICVRLLLPPDPLLSRCSWEAGPRCFAREAVGGLGLHGADPHVLGLGGSRPQVPPFVLCCFLRQVFLTLKVTSFLDLFTSPSLPSEVPTAG